jgi:hypothetical protein
MLGAPRSTFAAVGLMDVRLALLENSKSVSPRVARKYCCAVAARRIIGETEAMNRDTFTSELCPL